MYIFMHNLDNPETTVTNYVNVMTHTDVITTHHWARCAPCVDESYNLFTPSHWLKGLAVSFHLIHGHSHAHLFLSVVFFLLSFYLLFKSFFHLFLNSAMVPDENSMEDPLCNSAIGSMVSLDYVTPDTGPKRSVQFLKGTLRHVKIRERNGPSQGVTQHSVLHERSAYAPKFEDRS